MLREKSGAEYDLIRCPATPGIVGMAPKTLCLGGKTDPPT